MPSTRRWGARSKTRCARQTREYCHIEKNKSSVRSSSRRFKSIQQECAHTTTAALSVISCTDGGPAMAVRAGNCRRGGAGPPRPLRRRRLPVSSACERVSIAQEILFARQRRRLRTRTPPGSDAFKGVRVTRPCFRGRLPLRAAALRCIAAAYFTALTTVSTPGQRPRTRTRTDAARARAG